ncbi:unnamed protein product [Pleuronectes platessa]|uniref:Uncharacterized protein n=1 Tax=Pleuronectes platessa TaxID=8262 RepID=A0A9N7U1V3_PLEPL|nr:unnamed protein product [Pleuronectes platessa]
MLPGLQPTTTETSSPCSRIITAGQLVPVQTGSLYLTPFREITLFAENLETSLRLFVDKHLQQEHEAVAQEALTRGSAVRSQSSLIPFTIVSLGQKAFTVGARAASWLADGQEARAQQQQQLSAPQTQTKALRSQTHIHSLYTNTLMEKHLPRHPGKFSCTVRHLLGEGAERGRETERGREMERR